MATDEETDILRNGPVKVKRRDPPIGVLRTSGGLASWRPWAVCSSVIGAMTVPALRGWKRLRDNGRFTCRNRPSKS
jgi:hypothetical protein